MTITVNRHDGGPAITYTNCVPDRIFLNDGEVSFTTPDGRELNYPVGDVEFCAIWMYKEVAEAFRQHCKEFPSEFKSPNTFQQLQILQDVLVTLQQTNETLYKTLDILRRGGKFTKHEQEAASNQAIGLDEE